MPFTMLVRIKRYEPLLEFYELPLRLRLYEPRSLRSIIDIKAFVGIGISGERCCMACMSYVCVSAITRPRWQGPNPRAPGVGQSAVASGILYGILIPSYLYRTPISSIACLTRYLKPYMLRTRICSINHSCTEASSMSVIVVAESWCMQMLAVPTAADCMSTRWDSLRGTAVACCMWP